MKRRRIQENIHKKSENITFALVVERGTNAINARISILSLIIAKKRHLAKVYRLNRGSFSTHQIQNAEEPAQDILDSVRHFNKVEIIHAIKRSDKKILCLQIDGQTLEIKLGTRAACGFINSNTLRSI